MYVVISVFTYNSCVFFLRNIRQSDLTKLSDIKAEQSHFYIGANDRLVLDIGRFCGLFLYDSCSSTFLSVFPLAAHHLFASPHVSGTCFIDNLNVDAEHLSSQRPLLLRVHLRLCSEEAFDTVWRNFQIDPPCFAQTLMLDHRLLGSKEENCECTIRNESATNTSYPSHHYLYISPRHNSEYVQALSCIRCVGHMYYILIILLVVVVSPEHSEFNTYYVTIIPPPSSPPWRCVLAIDYLYICIGIA